MKKQLALSAGVAAVAALTLAATVFAAGPMGHGRGIAAAGAAGATGGSVVADVLDLTTQQIRDLRADGLSLAQIAERQDVEPQALVDALVARWTERIEARVEAGALTEAQTTQLKEQVELRAKDMTYKVTPGGMGGQAVGAGYGRMGGGPGHGPGNGVCDGTGPQRSTTP